MRHVVARGSVYMKEFTEEMTAIEYAKTLGSTESEIISSGDLELSYKVVLKEGVVESWVRKDGVVGLHCLVCGYVEWLAIEDQERCRHCGRAFVDADQIKARKTRERDDRIQRRIIERTKLDVKLALRNVIPFGYEIDNLHEIALMWLAELEDRIDKMERRRRER